MNINSFTTLNFLSVINKGTSDKVLSVEYDNRKVKNGSMFVAVKGFSSDGHNYIKGAIQNGASFVVLEDESFACDIDKSIWVLKTENSRTTLAKIATHFYNNPAEKMELIGVTGTNGKTSISTYVYNYYKNFKNTQTGLIGTINYFVGDNVIDAPNTTPESLDFEKLLADMVDCDTKIAISEVSSHALSLNRVDGSKFNISAFTNLTRDHLDFHTDMEDYFNAKAKLFNEYLAENGTCVINLDDEYGQRLFNSIQSKKVGYSLKNSDATIFAEIKKMTMHGTEISLKIADRVFEVSTKLIGKFNIENLMAVVGILLANNEKFEDIIDYTNKIKPVKGRFENITLNNNIHAIVDYAHTGDALKNVLETVKNIAEGKLITVFGAGGDRDKGKRSIMAEVASKYSDYTIVTSDNPRTENPSEIIKDILIGMTGNFEVEKDRSLAIKRAIEIADSEDVIVVAGKGHEDYQIIGKTKIHFSDFEQLEAWGKNG